ncbi:MAG: hypothetical protein OEY98_04990 [Acidimicrobiia bacterium]|nr:hypothetical protein [Acidimicrobiia bacterium]
MSVGPKELEHGFIVNQLTPPQSGRLAFLGDPLPAPFRGQPVSILRGSERVFGTVAATESSGIGAAMPLAADVSGAAGQVLGAEEHDPRNVVHSGWDLPDLDLSDLPADFAARVRKCWPKVMASFISLMQEPEPFEVGDYGTVG